MIIRSIFGLSMFWLLVLVMANGTCCAQPYAEGERRPLVLTAEEKAWIARHPVIRVHVSEAYPPFEFIDYGQRKGMACDYLAEISKRLGIKIKEVDISWDNALGEIGKTRGVDLLLTVTRSPEREKKIVFTKPYIVFPQVIVTHKQGKFVAGIKDLATSRVAVEKGYLMESWLKRDLPHAIILEKEDTASALEAVATGMADAYVGNLAVISYLLDKHGLTDLKVAAPADYGDASLSMGVRRDWPELKVMIDKALDSMSEDEQEEIRQKWLPVRYEHGLRLRDIAAWVLIVVAIALALIVKLRMVIKRRTSELDTSQSILQAMLDNSFEFQGLLELDGRVVDVNNSALDFAGITRESVVGRFFWETPWWEQGHVEQKRLRQSVEQCAKGEFVRYEAINKDRNGDLRVIDFSLKPLRNNAGRILYLISEARDITEMKRVEQSLKQQNSLLEAVFESSPFDIWVWDREYRLLAQNSRNEAHYGVSIGRTPLEDGIDPETFRQWIALYEPALAGETFQVETTEGDRIYRKVVAPLKDENGVCGILGFNTDITEYKRAGDAVRRSEQEIAALFMAAPVGIDYSNDGVFLNVNESLCDMTGYSRGELIGQPCKMLRKNDADFERVSEVFARVSATGEISSVEVVAKHKNGQDVYMLLRIALLAPGEPSAGFVTMSLDLTEKKRAEDNLKASEKRFRQVIEGAPMAISITRDKKYIYVNKTHAKLFGFDDPAEVIGAGYQERVAPHCLAEVTGYSAQLAGGETSTLQYETVGIRKDGSMFPYLLSSNRVVLADGPAIINFGLDMTERNHAHDLMIQTEKMMMIGGLAAGMAHEINNPLGIIVQALQVMEMRLSLSIDSNLKAADEIGIDLALVRKYLEKREIFDFMQRMKTAGQRTTKIMANMLQFSRQSDSCHQKSSLQNVIEQSIEMAESDYDLRKKYDFRNFNIIRDYQEDLPQVSINVTEIEQVFLNLFKNAAQEIFENGNIVNPTITISTRKNGDRVVIMVADNGPGMAENIKARIFEPFYTTKEVGAGTGLGLFVSYMLITNNHKGTMEVESSPGNGTCFTITLPLA